MKIKLIKNLFFIIVLFRIYLIEKMIFKFLKVIHGFLWLKIFLKFLKYLIQTNLL